MVLEGLNYYTVLHMGANLSEIREKTEAIRIGSPVSPFKRLLTLAEAAKYLGRGQDSFRELLYAKELKCIQKGRGKIWLDILELDQWIERNLHFM